MLIPGLLRYYRQPFVVNVLSKPVIAQNFKLSSRLPSNGIQCRLFILRSSHHQNAKSTSNQSEKQQKISLDPKAQQAEMLKAMLRRQRRPKLRENTLFHESDGLPTSEWTLIYHNKGSAWLVIMYVIYSTVTLICMAAGIQEIEERRKKFREANEPETIRNVVNRKVLLCIVGGLAVFATLWRFRRCWVVRIYEKNFGNHGKPPPVIVVKAGAPEPKVPLPVREYCIVGVNPIFRRRLFFYKNDQTDRILEASPLIVNIIGSFRARNRAWAVFQHYFEDPLDYYRARGKKVAGQNFVA